MSDKLPFVLAHVRLTCIGVDVEVLEALQKAIHAAVEAHAEVYGFRIKRRVLTAHQFADLFENYEKTHLITVERDRKTTP